MHHRRRRQRTRRHARTRAGSASRYMHFRERLIEHQLCHTGAVVGIEVIPLPAVAEGTAGKCRRVAGSDAAVNARHSRCLQRFDQWCEGEQRITTHRDRDARITGPAHDHVAAQDTAYHRPGTRERCTPAIIRAQLRQRHRTGHELLVRGWQHEHIGVHSGQRIASIGRDDQYAPVSARELRQRHQRVHELLQRRGLRLCGRHRRTIHRRHGNGHGACHRRRRYARARRHDRAECTCQLRTRHSGAEP